MFFHTTAFVLLFAGAVNPAPAQSCTAVAPAQAADEVRAAFAAWDEAVMRKDLEKTMAIFSPNIHFQFQGAPDFGYAHLLSIYKSNFAREDAPIWHPLVENVIGSADMVTLFSEWKLIPPGGGEAIADYRGVDVFQRDAACAWRVVASLNYADKQTISIAPRGQGVGPAQVNAANAANPALAANAPILRSPPF